MEKSKPQPLIHENTKLNSMWIIYLNIEAKMMKDVEENVGENLHDFKIGRDFLHKIQKA